MTCKNCGAELKEGTRFCGNCGAVIEVEKEPEVIQDSEIKTYDDEPKTDIELEVVASSAETEVEPAPTVQEPTKCVNPNEPVSVWKYFGLLVLYGIPIVGLIFVLLFSFGISENKNIKSFSRAIFLIRILTTILCVVAAVAMSKFAGDTIVDFIKMY